MSPSTPAPSLKRAATRLYDEINAIRKDLGTQYPALAEAWLLLGAALLAPPEAEAEEPRCGALHRKCDAFDCRHPAGSDGCGCECRCVQVVGATPCPTCHRYDLAPPPLAEEVVFKDERPDEALLRVFPVGSMPETVMSVLERARKGSGRSLPEFQSAMLHLIGKGELHLTSGLLLEHVSPPVEPPLIEDHEFVVSVAPAWVGRCGAWLRVSGETYRNPCGQSRSRHRSAQGGAR